jgi:glutamine synthetase adenylyltransferase
MLGFRHWLTVPSDELVSVIDSLDALPWLKQQEDELFAIKQRVELERLKFPTRDIKLGPGGLMDLQWVYRVSELRGIEPPDLTDEGAFLRRLRNRLHLLKLGDLMPVEGSEELERLEIGMEEKNLVQKLADLRHNVRTSFETLRRI